MARCALADVVDGDDVRPGPLNNLPAQGYRPAIFPLLKNLPANPRLQRTRSAALRSPLSRGLSGAGVAANLCPADCYRVTTHSAGCSFLSSEASGLKNS